MVSNQIRKEIFKQEFDPLCCLCRSKYTNRHNRICQYLHWCILQDFHIQVNKDWRKHKPKPAVLISNKISVSYDLTQEVDTA
eukprot:2422474-Ditylum_brightwellii.AAC.1